MPKTQFAINYLSKIKILLGASQLCNEYKYLEQKLRGTSATALVIRFCQQGLGLEPGSASSVTDETLDARIDSRLSICIDSCLAPIQEKLAALESALGEFNA